MRQRVMLAIALACGPKMLFADEPTTALDVTVQAQILDLLQTQQRERFMAMILVTHDLGVVAGPRRRHRSDVRGQDRREGAGARRCFAQMRHPYTEALMKSIPKLALPSHTRLESIAGRPPDLVHPPKGCSFAPRCPYAQARCHEEEPQLEPHGSSGHEFACFYPVGTPEGADALAANQAPPSASNARCHVIARLGDGLMAGSGTAHLRAADETLLRVEHLVVEFPIGRTGLKVNAVSDVSLDIKRGRDARPRRRVGLREVDDRQGDHAAAAHRRPGSVDVRRHRSHEAARRGAAHAYARASR